MSEKTMTLAEVLAVIDGLFNAQAPGAGPSRDSVLQARAAVSALVAERDARREDLHSACADAAATEHRAAEVEAENARLREAIAKSSDLFLAALAGASNG